MQKLRVREKWAYGIIVVTVRLCPKESVSLKNRDKGSSTNLGFFFRGCECINGQDSNNL